MLALLKKIAKVIATEADSLHKRTSVRGDRMSRHSNRDTLLLTITERLPG